MLFGGQRFMGKEKTPSVDWGDNRGAVRTVWICWFESHSTNHVGVGDWLSNLRASRLL